MLIAEAPANAQQEQIVITLSPEASALLRRYAQYVKDIDWEDATPDELGESLIVGYLDDVHMQFQEWILDPLWTFKKWGLRATAQRNLNRERRRSKTMPGVQCKRSFRVRTHPKAPTRYIWKGTKASWVTIILRH